MVDSNTSITGQDMILDMVTRIRDIEGKYNLLRDRALLINQNMIEQYQKTHTELKTINEDVRQIKEELFHIKETLKHIIKELEHFSRKEEMHVLEKYINLWNPMKFVTENDVKRIVRDEINGKKDGG